ncbi:MAG TPA: hypothetical protein VMT52_02285 [Planctomycetota bacterium]|nr:hypothetical protein [Planctomycetota bacterium]
MRSAIPALLLAELLLIPVSAAAQGKTSKDASPPSSREDRERAAGEESSDPRGGPPAERGLEGQGRQDSRDASRGDDSRVRQIEEALLRELESAEGRIRSIQARFEALRSGSRPVPRPETRRGPAAPLEAATREEEERHQTLLEREREILGRWKQLQPRLAAEARGPVVRENESPSLQADIRKIRAELRAVLAERLELRERARERLLARLRAELEALEASLSLRRGPKERQALVESRLEELLGREGKG